MSAMPKIKVLGKELYELIAAGEVVDRPSSIIKELTENSIDSGAHSITAEIKQGGISYMRVTDNGCGIASDDLPAAFIRHATSKISSAEDLNNILTLGFRGEALASVAAVSKVDVLTRPSEEEYGAHYVIEGTEEKLLEKCGCPAGTTIVIRDIFYNVPARLKFLKKDVTEGNDIARVMEKIALSRPDISVRFIRDNKQVMFTPGDGKLLSAIYSVLGRQFACSLIPVDYQINGIKVTGFTVKPIFGLKNRRLQIFFVNGRYVQSFVCMRALEEAYTNCIMEGKFPACVLQIEIAPGMVDVNVHPKKTDVRFTDDKLIYDAVYFAVKNAVLSDSEPEEMVIPAPKPNYSLNPFADNKEYVQTKVTDKGFTHISAEEYRKSMSVPLKQKRVSAEDYKSMATGNPPVTEKKAVTSEPPCDNPNRKPIPEDECHIEDLTPAKNIGEFKYIDGEAFQVIDIPEPKPPKRTVSEAVSFKYIGEAFGTYIIAETDGGLIIIDKHAAHERINFEDLKSGAVKLACQMLLSSEELRLSYGEYDAVRDNLKIIKDLGFDIELSEAPFIKIKGIPSILDACDSADITSELAKNLEENKRNPSPQILDDMLHSIACKASVRARDKNAPEELSAIVKRVLEDENIRYCPHGRPVMFKLSSRELEKQFKRIVS